GFEFLNALGNGRTESCDFSAGDHRPGHIFDVAADKDFSIAGQKSGADGVFVIRSVSVLSNFPCLLNELFDFAASLHTWRSNLKGGSRNLRQPLLYFQEPLRE